MVGTTPLLLSAVTSGTHLIDIRAPGYNANSLQVLVRQNDTLTISPVLTKSSSPTPVSIVTILTGIVISLAVIIACVKRKRT